MEYVWLRELVPQLWKWQALDLKIFPLFLMVLICGVLEFVV